VAATNRDLAVMVEKGTFRKDLFYRLNVVNLRLPSLRDRREDIPLLAAHFLDRISREHGTKFTLSDEALRTMMRHDWPGNVRELENSVERACALSSGPVLHTWATCPRNCSSRVWKPGAPRSAQASHRPRAPHRNWPRWLIWNAKPYWAPFAP
jgi:two-component system response regulator HydG